MPEMHVSDFETLDDAKEHYLVKLDSMAETARGRFITKGSGQSMTYDAKYIEALRYPNEGPFPWLEGEAHALDMSIEEVANSVLAAREEWQAIGVAIEAARLKAKKGIRNSLTVADMHRIVEKFRADLA